MFVFFPLGTRIDTSNEWLLQKLPGLPCFADFYPQLSHQLRSACIVESDPAAVSLYIQFLAHYTPEGLHDLADLCLDMSATVVERSTLLTAIMPGSMCKTNQVSIATTVDGSDFGAKDEAPPVKKMKFETRK